MAQEWTGLSSNRTIADVTKAVGDSIVEREISRPTEKQKRYYKMLLNECIKYKLDIIRPRELYNSYDGWRAAYDQAIKETIKILDADGRWDGYEKERKFYTHDSARDRNRNRSKRAFAHVPKY